MKRALVSSVVATFGLVLLWAAPASAQQLAIGDPQGDVGINTLDIISVTLHNDDRSVLAAIEVEDATRDGNLTVSVDPRGGPGVRIVSRFRATGGTKSYVLRKAFSDPGTSTKKVRCKVRLGHDWSGAGNPVITLRIPSRCLAGGNYGALRFGAVSQLGGDRDITPFDRRGRLSASDWVARG
jgi:hypothetical protein